MPTYTVTSHSIEHAERGANVTTFAQDRPGATLVFQSHARWVWIPKAGVKKSAGPADDGIYTTGQLQCVAVILAKFNQGRWTEAHLAHVGHETHSLVGELIAMAGASTGYCVAIGGRCGSANRMMTIASGFLGKARNVCVYIAQDHSPDFGMNREGFFGETVQWVSARPRR